MKQLPIDTSNINLNIILVLSALVIALVSFGAEFGEIKGLEFIRPLKFRIPVLIFFFIITAAATVIKDMNNDVRNSNDLYTRDSLNQQKFNQSLKVASNATSETMAKYYLKYVSGQQKIEELVKDTSLRGSKTIEIATDATPEFDIINIFLKKNKSDSITFDFRVISRKTAIKNLNLHLQYLLTNHKQNLTISLPGKFLPKNMDLTGDEIYGTLVNVEPKGQNIDRVYFYITGSYEYKKKKNPVEFVRFFNINSGEWGTPADKDIVLETFKHPQFYTPILEQFYYSTHQ